MLKKYILLAAGGTVFAAGLILFPLPVPLGLPAMAIGLLIMLKASNKAKRTVVSLFKKNRHSAHIWRKARELRRKVR